MRSSVKEKFRGLYIAIYTEVHPVLLVVYEIEVMTQALLYWCMNYI